MNYMQELDQWTDENVLVPIVESWQTGKDRDFEDAQDAVRKAIRIKVLESYRNGAKRCPNCHGERSEKPAQRPLRRPFRRERH